MFPLVRLKIQLSLKYCIEKNKILQKWFLLFKKCLSEKVFIIEPFSYLVNISTYSIGLSFEWKKGKKLLPISHDEHKTENI